MFSGWWWWNKGWVAFIKDSSFWSARFYTYTYLTLNILQICTNLMSFLFIYRFSKKFERLAWQQVNTRFGKEYNNVLSLFDLILTIPGTSTACERGFSHMKVITSDKQTLMKEATLSNSMKIKLEGPSIKQFNPDVAIYLWFNRCSRRPATEGSQENKSGWCQISVIINTEIK